MTEPNEDRASPSALGRGTPRQRLLTVREAAAYLGVHKGFLYKRLMKGREHEAPRAIRISRRKVLFAVEDLDAWLEARRTPPAKTAA